MATRVFAALLILWGVSGCQTMPTRHDIKVPAVLDPLFILCLPGDGAMTLEAFDDGQVLGSGESEWVAQATGDWDLEVSNSVGQAMLKVARRGESIRPEGRLAAKLPEFGVDSHGFLEVDGHLIGVKADELPCMLNFGLPRAWMALADDLEISGSTAKLHFSDEVRSIAVTAKALGQKGKERVCTELTWRTFLWFHDTLTWCESPWGKPEATLSGIRDYSLKWVKLDER